MSSKCKGQYLLESERALVERLNEDLTIYGEMGMLASHEMDLIPKWKALAGKEPHRFINGDQTVNVEALGAFRGLQIFISDSPAWDTRKPSVRNVLDGGRRGASRMLRECLSVLKENGYDELLRKYPCHKAGKPHVFKYQGFEYTLRWFKHIYCLGLMNKVIGSRLHGDFVGLDIGSSYGIFSSIVKKDYPGSHHVLVDFPEQLILAHYFLGTCFPHMNIASIKELAGKDILSTEFIKKYDFVLVPCSLYSKIASGAVDIITNFASLGEMSRSWFDHYLESSVFLTARFFFTANRVQSYPTYQTDLTILDYPIWDRRKRLHFGVCPAFFGYYNYSRRYLFFIEKSTFPPYFEYIGEI